MIQADVYSLLSSLNVGTVYPDNLPVDAVYPCTVYSQTSEDIEHTLDGTPIAAGVAEIKLEIISPDNSAVNTTAMWWRQKLDGYNGVNGQTWSLWRLASESENSVSYNELGDIWLTVRSLEFSVRHSVPHYRAFSAGFSSAFA